MLVILHDAIKKYFKIKSDEATWSVSCQQFFRIKWHFTQFRPLAGLAHTVKLKQPQQISNLNKFMLTRFIPHCHSRARAEISQANSSCNSGPVVCSQRRNLPLHERPSRPVSTGARWALSPNDRRESATGSAAPRVCLCCSRCSPRTALGSRNAPTLCRPRSVGSWFLCLGRPLVPPLCKCLTWTSAGFHETGGSLPCLCLLCNREWEILLHNVEVVVRNLFELILQWECRRRPVSLLLEFCWLGSVGCCRFLGA